ncbi:type II toxin-antitoxin system HicA family toxin [Flavobacteriaceae bacterium M23B6Z8]
MGEHNNPVPTKCWEKFLLNLGCEFKRQQGTHHHWKCPECFRTITFWGHKKDIPRFHIKTCLKTLKVTNKEFNEWASENCK